MKKVKTRVYILDRNNEQYTSVNIKVFFLVSGNLLSLVAFYKTQPNSFWEKLGLFFLVWSFQLCQQTWQRFMFYVLTPVCLFVCQQDV